MGMWILVYIHKVRRKGMSFMLSKFTTYSTIQRKFVFNSIQVLKYDILDMRKDLTCKEVPKKILACEEKVLWKKNIVLAKVL